MCSALTVLKYSHDTLSKPERIVQVRRWLLAVATYNVRMFTKWMSAAGVLIDPFNQYGRSFKNSGGVQPEPSAAGC